MPGKLLRILLPLLALAAGLAASACGTVATPEWAAEAQSTRVALAATDDHLTAIAPTATPTTAPTETPVPATATEVAPTATAVPPTETPAPATETPVPTTEAAATEEPMHMDDHGAAPAGNDEAIEAALAAGNPENGQVIFTTMHQTANGTWACAQCHSVTPDQMRIIGPGLWNIREHGAGHVEGLNAVEYIHQSIVDPSAYVVPDYPDNLMPKDWGTVLTEQELNDVIAYLLTLHD